MLQTNYDVNKTKSPLTETCQKVSKRQCNYLVNKSAGIITFLLKLKTVLFATVVTLFTV